MGSSFQVPNLATLPTGGFRSSRQSGQMRVEQVTDWQAVALRYLALRGQSDGTLLERDSAPHKEAGMAQPPCSLSNALS